jgi:FlaA1/EpsC-like NDP-sugar epimerase
LSGQEVRTTDSAHGIEIRYVGLRPGEKLYEELLADADTSLPSAHPRLRIAQLQTQVDAVWAPRLLSWLSSADSSVPVEERRKVLQGFVPEYTAS